MGGAATVVCLQQLKSILGLEHFTHEADLVSVLRSVFSQTHEVKYLPLLPCLFPLSTISFLHYTYITYNTRYIIGTHCHMPLIIVSIIFKEKCIVGSHCTLLYFIKRYSSWFRNLSLQLAIMEHVSILLKKVLWPYCSWGVFKTPRTIEFWLRHSYGLMASFIHSFDLWFCVAVEMGKRCIRVLLYFLLAHHPILCKWTAPKLTRKYMYFK